MSRCARPGEPPSRIRKESRLRATALELNPFVDMAREAILREYPALLLLPLESAADLGLPRTLTPAFHGSYDWHSAVHGHWCLVRAARLHPAAEWAAEARSALSRTLTAANLAAEFRFVERRPGFERPYGLAWLLQLAAELRAWEDDPARGWSEALAPLESLASARLSSWADKLPWPVRSGEHSQSAFALGLALDWARATSQHAIHDRLARACVRLYRDDTAAPVAYEPSGQDFLSPVLGEADLMRRVLPRAEYANWISSFLPDTHDEAFTRWLQPVRAVDRSDGKFAHLDGLNLSRAWMLRGIVTALPEGHECYSVLERAAARHAAAGLEGARGTDWMGTHWLGSFAVYLLTDRGLE
jgi:hypothetical protein